MKRVVICVFILFGFLFFCNYPFTGNQIMTNDNYLIKNENTALRVAEAILFEHYGKMKIYMEKPFVICIKSDSLWYIHGTSYTTGIASGGVFHITISARNGEIFDMYHDK